MCNHLLNVPVLLRFVLTYRNKEKSKMLQTVDDSRFRILQIASNSPTIFVIAIMMNIYIYFFLPYFRFLNCLNEIVWIHGTHYWYTNKGMWWYRFTSAHCMVGYNNNNNNNTHCGLTRVYKAALATWICNEFSSGGTREKKKNEGKYFGPLTMQAKHIWVIFCCQK